jgi:hypothetical protein
VLRRDASGVVTSGNSVPNNSPLLTTDSTSTLTGKTIDGDDNTVQDLALTSLKTVLGDANKLLQRDASGIVISGNTVPNTSAIVTLDATQTLTNKSIDADTNTITNIENADIKSGAAIDAAKLADGSVDNTEFQRLGTAGTAGAGNLVTTDGTQTLSNKTLTSPVLTSPSTTNFLELDDQASDPSAPAGAGDVRVYAKDDKVYQINSLGSISELGAGGAGGINYITNPDAEVDTTGWATYADAAGVAPVDGTGGSPNVTWTRSTSSPLRGAASFLFTKDAANRQGQGVSDAFTIDSADVSKTLQISFDFEALSGYVANDMRVYIYDVTNAVLITPAAVDIAAAKFQFQTTFVASTSTSYRLIFHVSSTNAAAYTARFDNVVVGPQLLSLGTAMSDWASFTPVTQGFGTISSTSMSFTRAGSTVKVLGDFVVGTSTAVEARINLPQLTTSATTSLTMVGQWWRNTASSSSVKKGAIIASPGEGYVKFSLDEFTLGASPATAAIGNALFIPGDRYYFSFEVPIAEWAGSSVYLSTAQPEYVYNSNTSASTDTTSFANGPIGGLVPQSALAGTILKRVRFLTPVQATDKVTLQVSPNTGGERWVDMVGNTTDTDGDIMCALIRQNANEYGIGIAPNATIATDYDVTFGRYRFPVGATYGAAGSDWGATSTWRWRVVKVPGQVQVASPVLPTATSMSDISATALGLKVYSHGTTYNGGIAPTVSGINWITSRGVFIPYQVQDGTWRLRFNFTGTFTSSTSNAWSINVNGITSKNAANVSQGCALAYPANPPVAATAYLSTNSNTFQVRTASAVTPAGTLYWGISGDVELESKPTWAY